MYQILIADDHPLYREAIAGVIGRAFGGAAVVEAEDFDSALAAIDHNDELDLVLLDLNMPGMDGLNGLIQMRNTAPDVPVAMISPPLSPPSGPRCSGGSDAITSSRNAQRSAMVAASGPDCPRRSEPSSSWLISITWSASSM